MKLAFGADAQTLARVQLSAHEERLDELRRLATTLEVAGATEEQLLVAEAGIGHSREYVRFWKKLAGR